MKIYICVDCGEIFDEPSDIIEDDDGYFATFIPRREEDRIVCPYCESNNVELYEEI